jgi:excinuclease ABC subunit B
LVDNQYARNDVEIARGRFRVRGDVLEIGPAYEDRLVRIELFGDEVEAIRYVDPTTGEILQSLESINIYPAKHFVTPKDRLEDAIKAIRGELRERLDLLNGEGRLLEAQRLEQRSHDERLEPLSGVLERVAPPRRRGFVVRAARERRAGGE